MYVSAGILEVAGNGTEKDDMTPKEPGYRIINTRNSKERRLFVCNGWLHETAREQVMRGRIRRDNEHIGTGQDHTGDAVSAQARSVNEARTSDTGTYWARKMAGSDHIVKDRGDQGSPEHMGTMPTHTSGYSL